MNSSKKIIVSVTLMVMVMMMPVVAFAQSKPRITSPSDRSSSTLGNDVNVYVSGNNIEVIYAGLYGNPNPSNSSESNFYKGTMYQSSNKFFFTPNTSTWENKWVKIIAHDKSSDLWSDPVYVQINPKQQQTKQTLAQPQWITKPPSNAIGNTNVTISWTPVANAKNYSIELTCNGQHLSSYTPTGTSQAITIPNVSGTVYVGVIAVPTSYEQYNQSGQLQAYFTVSVPTKPTITTDKSTYNLGDQVNVTVGNTNNGKITVIYAGLNGNPAYNDNESNFYKGNMYSSGNNKFFFTPNTNTWSNKWVKIVAYNETNNLWSDSKYVQIAAPIANNATGMGTVNIPIPSNGGILKYSSGKNDELYIPVKPLNDMQNIINKRVRDFVAQNYSKNLTDAIVGQFIDASVAEGASVAVAAGLVSNPVGASIASAYAAYSIVKSGIDLGITTYKVGLGNKLIEYSNKTNGYIIIQMSKGLFEPAISYTNQTTITSSAAKNIVAMNNISDSDIDQIGKTFRMYQLDISDLHLVSAPQLNTISGSVSATNSLVLKGNADFSKYYVYLDLFCDNCNKFIIEKKNLYGSQKITNGTICTILQNEHQFYKHYGHSIGANLIHKDKTNPSLSNSGTRITFKIEEQPQFTTRAETTAPITQQQPQTFTTSNFTKIGNATLANYSGKNFIGMINATSGFRFLVNSNSTKTATFTITYRSDNRNGKLVVNGVTQIVSFPSTNWNWGTKTVQISLRQGTNTIEFYGGYPTSNDWAPDIAEITVN